MYNRNRGRAEPQTFSDDQTRNTNFTMMQRKRKQQLEEQLENKESLLRQYTNPRGIGMRGQTVNPRDVEILQEQIQGLKTQLEQITNPGGGQALGPGAPGSSSGFGGSQSNISGSQLGGSQAQMMGGGGINQGGYGPGAPPPGRIRGGSASGQSQQGNVNPGSYPINQQQQPPGSMNQFGNQNRDAPPSVAGSIGAASRISKGTTSGQSKRDEVYDRKYQNWLERTSTRGGTSLLASGPVLTSLKINNGPFNQQNQQGIGYSGATQNSGATGSTAQLTTSTGVGGRHRDQPASQWGGQQQPAPQLSQQPSQPYTQRSGNQSQYGGSQQSQQHQGGGYGLQAPSQVSSGQVQRGQQYQQPGGQQQQQQPPPQNQPQYGRRATPTDGQRPPVPSQQNGGNFMGGQSQQNYQQSQNQRQQQQQGGGNFMGGQQQPQQQQQQQPQQQQPLAGRRSAGASRPW